MFKSHLVKKHIIISPVCHNACNCFYLEQTTAINYSPHHGYFKRMGPMQSHMSYILFVNHVLCSKTLKKSA